MERDLTWDAMFTVAARMDDDARSEGIDIVAARDRSLRRWSVTEGLRADDGSTELFEPVRTRPFIGGTWEEIQPGKDAAANIGAFLRNRSAPGR